MAWQPADAGAAKRAAISQPANLARHENRSNGVSSDQRRAREKLRRHRPLQQPRNRAWQPGLKEQPRHWWLLLLHPMHLGWCLGWIIQLDHAVLIATVNFGPMGGGDVSAKRPNVPRANG
jgi:hypothetical protein